MNTHISNDDVSVVILAGGRARRMGGHDKGLIKLAGHPLIHHVITRIQPQCPRIMISANRNKTTYEQFGWPVISDQSLLGQSIPDQSSDYAGPLAGIVSAMQHCDTPYLLCVPCDMPLIPRDLLSRLGDALIKQPRDIAVVFDGERTQPLCALLPCQLKFSLHDFLNAGQHGVQQWLKIQSVATANFDNKDHSFFNINTDQDCQIASQYLTSDQL